MKNYGLLFSWIIACVATLGSLYFGEITHHEPCTLCWYQRIAMFPLALLLGIAFFKNESKIIPYLIPLALIGLFLALIHLLLQYMPTSFFEFFCTGKESCVVQRSFFGKASLSFLSLIGFILLNGCLIWANRAKK